MVGRVPKLLAGKTSGALLGGSRVLFVGFSCFGLASGCALGLSDSVAPEMDRAECERLEAERGVQAVAAEQRRVEQQLQHLAVVNAMEEQQRVQQRILEAQMRKSDSDRDLRKRIGKDLPTMASLKNPKEITHFLTHFQRQMSQFEIPRNQWTTLLRPLLDDDSMTYMTRLPMETQDDFAALSKELIAFHGITKEYHRSQWDSFTILKDEDPLQTERRAAAIVENWTADARTPQDFRSHFTTHLFLGPLAPDVAAWTDPQDSREVARITSRFKASQISSKLPPLKHDSYRLSSAFSVPSITLCSVLFCS